VVVRPGLFGGLRRVLGAAGAGGRGVHLGRGDVPDGGAGGGIGGAGPRGRRLGRPVLWVAGSTPVFEFSPSCAELADVGSGGAMDGAA